MINAEELYCYYCMSSFLNAATLCTIRIWDSYGSIVSDGVFNERGYDAAIKLGQLRKLAEADGGKLVVTMNQVQSELMLFAVTIVDGTAVCPMHVWDVVNGRRAR